MRVGRGGTRGGACPCLSHHYQWAYRSLKKRGDPFGEAYGLCGQANAHRTFGDAAQGLPLYRRSAALYRRLGDESSEAFAHWGLGGSYRRLKRFSLALASYAQAVRLFHKSKDDRGRVMTFLGLARLAEDAGRRRSALGEAARALAVARRSKLRYETALARYEIGRIQRPLRPPHGILKPMGLSASVLRRWRDIP
ncbi:MAG: tetratricopeptide repeat protein [Elusimicrobia bacterium]|nr:tetratricopeptide repeat protein [Elusimicrobiota bacterium]